MRPFLFFPYKISRRLFEPLGHLRRDFLRLGFRNRQRPCGGEVFDGFFQVRIGGVQIFLGGMNILVARKLADGVNVAAAAQRVGAKRRARIVPAVINSDRLFDRFPRRRGDVFDGTRHAGSVPAEQDEVNITAHVDSVFFPVFLGKVRVFLQNIPKVAHLCHGLKGGKCYP